MMTKLFQGLLATTCVASLTTGCVRKDGTPTDEINRAIPTSDQVSIHLPAQARAVGQLSNYYVVTRDVTRTFNGGAAWALILIHAIVQQPVTSVHGDTYTWGPGSQPLDPADYRLDVT